MAASNSSSVRYESDPLDLIQMHINTKNGIRAAVPAIHIGFKESRYFVPFQCPPANQQNNSSYQAEEDEWLESARFIEEDLHWLLRAPHHRFWSQVVNDEELHIFIDAYLTHAPRHYDLTRLCFSENISTYLEKFHSLFFKLLLRMSTHKESRLHHITPEGFADIIYDNYVFDIPRMMDLCSLYGYENPALVTKMIVNIFKHQPKYSEDLNTTSQSILETLTSIEEQLGVIFHERQTKSSHLPHKDPRKEMDFYHSFHDIVNYITDVSFTFYIFLEIYSPACQTFYQNGATLRLATFYEHVFTQIEKEISRQKFNKEAKSLFEDMRGKVCLSKTLLVKLFRNILNYCLIADIIDSSSTASKNVSSSTEHFLDIFTLLGKEKHFLKDYNVLFPFESDVELFTQMNLQLDYDRLNYIFLSMHDTDDAPSQSSAAPELVKKPESRKKRQKDERLELPSAASHEEPIAGSSNLASASAIPDKQMDSLITSVQDVLPHLGEGFIERCLLHYHYDDALVIDAVLSNALPDELTCLDHQLKREAVPSYSILSERKNVFDNDEFDFFSKTNIQMESIHIGKKDKTPASYQSLKTTDSESEFLKKLTLAYEEETAFAEQDGYDDEYDDTYDSAMIGLKEPIPEGEPEPESTNDVKTEEPKRDTSRDFCTNPEEQRERYAQRRESQMNRRGGPPPRDSNHSRQNNERHKGQVGNHNRRKQADYKRSRGMGPL